ncbi:SDR family NAD(P)-dependent oxidoreductase [Cellulomonas sp. 179-A 4D5 NHS]|uniref:SDR family NAD(P)-dependent oxidoreductase n=1 Tax=Cellulomonas sp. 179-A 4D5 NHS TaxID=3142378 RepID=UPI0039A37AE0
MPAVDYRDQTTLVTGASSGIGAEFARQLAARGSDLVLVARRRDRLDALAAELVAAHGVRATVIPLDLGEPSAVADLVAELDRQGLRVTSLVNNAGFATHSPFHDEDPDRVREEITLNVLALVELTHALIDDLRAAGNGVLVTLSSIAAYQGNPNLAVYGATKAFVLSFTEALWGEARGTGLRVLALSPGATETEFFDVAQWRTSGGGTRRQTVEQVVATALRTLDRRNPPPSVVSGAANRAFVAVSRLVTRRRLALLMGSLMRRPEDDPAPARARRVRGR